MKQHEHKHAMQSFQVCNFQVYLHYPVRIFKMGLSLRTTTEACYAAVFPVVMENIWQQEGRGTQSRLFLLDNALDPLPSCNHSHPYSHDLLFQRRLPVLAHAPGCLSLKAARQQVLTVKEESGQLPMIYITRAFQRIPFLLFVTKLLLLPSQLLSFSSNTFGFLTTLLQTTQKEEPTNAKWKHR